MMFNNSCLFRKPTMVLYSEGDTILASDEAFGMRVSLIVAGGKQHHPLALVTCSLLVRVTVTVITRA